MLKHWIFNLQSVFIGYHCAPYWSNNLTCLLLIKFFTYGCVYELDIFGRRFRRENRYSHARSSLKQTHQAACCVSCLKGSSSPRKWGYTVSIYCPCRAARYATFLEIIFRVVNTPGVYHIIRFPVIYLNKVESCVSGNVKVILGSLSPLLHSPSWRVKSQRCWICSMFVWNKWLYNYGRNIYTVRGYLEDQDIVGKIILKWVLEIFVVRTELNWLKGWARGIFFVMINHFHTEYSLKGRINR